MPTYKAFFASPFSPDFRWIRNAAATACRETGVEFRAVDETTAPGEPVVQSIYQEISGADFGIVVATGNNPNVFYELGLLHCRSKPTVIMTDQSQQTLPFDIRGLLSIRYDGAKKDEADVALAIKGAIASLIHLLSPDGRAEFRHGKLPPPPTADLQSTRVQFNGIDFEKLKEQAAKNSGKTGCDTRQISEYDDNRIKGWAVRAHCQGGYRMMVIIDLNGIIRHVEIEAN